MDARSYAGRLEVIAWLKDIMPSNNVDYEGDNASDLATALVTQQEARWSAFFDFFDGYPLWQSLVRPLRDIVKNNIPPRKHKYDNKYVVSSRVPLITKDIPVGDRGFAEEVAPLVLSYVLEGCKQTITTNSDPILHSWLLGASVAELTYLTLIDFNNIDARKQTEKLVNEFHDSLVSTRLELIELAIKAKSLNEHLAKQVEETDIAKAKLSQNIRDSQEEWTTERKKFFDTVKREVAEYTKVEASLNLWHSKARWHYAGFGACAFLFAGALGAAPFVIVTRGIPFVEKLASTFAGDKEYLGIALLVIPALAIAWLLRFIARIALQNLVLAQDARQRHAQIATYLRLMSDNALLKGERILALSAIFRPLSGQGGDDINPPTVVELLKETLDQAVSKKS